MISILFLIYCVSILEIIFILLKITKHFDQNTEKIGMTFNINSDTIMGQQGLLMKIT